MRNLNFEYVKNYIQSVGCELISDKYINNSTKMKILFSCGHIGERTFADFSGGCLSVCGKCSKNVKYSFKEVEEKFLNYGFMLEGNQEYKNANTKLTFCDKDGYKYHYSLHCLDNSMIYGNGKINKFEITNIYALDNMKLWININNKPYSFSCEEYKGSHYSNLVFSCNKCNHIWKTSWSCVYSNNTGCPVCAIDKRAEQSSQRNISNLINLATLYPFLKEEWDYNKNKKPPEKYSPNSNAKVWWICSRCGHNWEAIVYSRTKGNGCSVCNLSGGAKRIYYFLKSNNIYFDIEYWFEDLLSDNGVPLRYDFGLRACNDIILIEFDHQQHERFIPFLHKTIDAFNLAQKYDEMKNQYCLKNNYKLIRISHYDYDNIESILSKELNLNFSEHEICAERKEN